MKQRWENHSLEKYSIERKVWPRFHACESRRTFEKRRKSTMLGQRYGIDASPAQQLDSQSSHHRARRRQKE